MRQAHGKLTDSLLSGGCSTRPEISLQMIENIGNRVLGSGVTDKGCFGWAEEEGGKTRARSSRPAEATFISPSKTPGAMFLKSNNYEANSYQRRVPCPDEPRSRKTGTGSSFPHQHRHSNNHPVKAETGCLSQRFAPSEKPKPSPEATVPPFSTRFHPPLRRTRRGRSQRK
jgi:hypothetical protein